MKPSVSAWRHKGETDKAPYQYKGCGLEDVYLLSGYDIHTSPYGEGVFIKSMDELHRAIGCYLVRQKKDLSGKELRFLRKEMDLTQSELGRMIGLTSQQVARWEKGESEISGPADRMVRLLFLEHAGGSLHIRSLAESIEQLDTAQIGKKYFENTGHGWKKAVNE